MCSYRIPNASVALALRIPRTISCISVLSGISYNQEFCTAVLGARQNNTRKLLWQTPLVPRPYPLTKAHLKYGMLGGLGGPSPLV